MDKEECVRGADVIVTATYSSEPLVYLEWLKAGAHLNGIAITALLKKLKQTHMTIWF